MTRTSKFCVGFLPRCLSRLPNRSLMRRAVIIVFLIVATQCLPGCEIGVLVIGGAIQSALAPRPVGSLSHRILAGNAAGEACALACENIHLRGQPVTTVIRRDSARYRRFHQCFRGCPGVVERPGACTQVDMPPRALCYTIVTDQPFDVPARQMAQPVAPNPQSAPCGSFCL